MIDVVSLKVLPEMRLAVAFSDGSGGAFDARAMLAEDGPMVVPLRDPAYFSRVFIEAGAPTWPNGFDIAPDWLRHEMATAGTLQREPSAA